MYKKSLISAGLLLLIPHAYANNPASTDWVKNYVQSQITSISGLMPPGGTTGQVLTKLTDANYNTTWSTPSSSSTISASDWEALCPSGQSLTNSAGCQPDCTGSEASACTKILTATNFLPLFALPAPSSNSVIAFSFTPDATVSGQGPTMSPPSTTGNYAHCMPFSVLGSILPQAINNTTVGVTTPTLQTAVTLQQGQASQVITILAQTASNPGAYSASTNTYYVLCSGYTVSSNIPSSANVTGVTGTW